jgi:hypothetical protein
VLRADITYWPQKVENERRFLKDDVLIRPESTDCDENVWPAPFARSLVEIGGSVCFNVSNFAKKGTVTAFASTIAA